MDQNRTNRLPEYNSLFALILTVLATMLPFHVQSAPAHHTLTLYAASSLSVALPKLIDGYYEETGNKVKVIYAGSGQLARQLTHGAEADLFISANVKWSNAVLDDENREAAQLGDLISNQLVVVASPYSKFDSEQPFEPESIEWWQQRLGKSRLAIGQPQSVPVGMYAQQALSTMQLWQPLQSKMAPAKNTRSVLALVERGQSPIGVVYASDAHLSDTVTVLGALDTHLHAPIQYPMVGLTQSPELQTLVDYLLSYEAQQQLVELGFKR